MRNVYAVLLFCACFSLARWITARSWDGHVYVYVGERRAPSSVRKVEDYTPVRASALSESVHAQVMDGAFIDTSSAGAIGIKLGHPLVPDEMGTRGFACAIPGHSGLYDRVRVTLYGTGVTDNGNEPHLDVDTVCKSSAGLDALDTIWVPMAEILKQPTADGEETLPDANQTVITRSNLPGTWPESWTLVSVQFYNSGDANSALTLSAADLRADGATLLSFGWKTNGATAQ